MGNDSLTVEEDQGEEKNSEAIENAENSARSKLEDLLELKMDRKR